MDDELNLHRINGYGRVLAAQAVLAEAWRAGIDVYLGRDYKLYIIGCTPPRVLAGIYAHYDDIAAELEFHSMQVKRARRIMRLRRGRTRHNRDGYVIH